jgi:TRAP transporter TAXI family solute receptor
MAARDFLRANWPVVAITATAVGILVAAVMLLRTMPPRTLVMATGPEGGAYHEIGRRYRQLLAREGVTLRLRPTSGALENLALLRDPRSGVGVALIQDGIAGEDQAGDLESLGTVFYEPLWMFYRSELRGVALHGLHGRKVSIGPEGSGTRALSLELLKRNGVDLDALELLALSPQAATDKLLAGEIDVAMMLISSDAPLVRTLLADERVELASFPYADAYVALYPFLNKVVVPAGVGDLAKNRPPSDVTMFAPKASLIVRNDLHSALQFLLLNTATLIHSSPGIFRRAGQFPAAEAIEFPLSNVALQFYKSGRPFLQNYLPFWMASLMGRLLILLIPILGLLYPMMRFLPMLYDWFMRRKITRLYGELRFLEHDMEARGATARSGDSKIDDMPARLDLLEKQANRLRVPAAYASMLYMLRNHIALVRQRLQEH